MHSGIVGPRPWGGSQDPGPCGGNLGWDPRVEPWGGTVRWDPIAGPWGRRLVWDTGVRP